MYQRANKNNMKVRVIGDITGLSEDLQEKIVELEKASKDNTGINFTIARIMEVVMRWCEL